MAWIRDPSASIRDNLMMHLADRLQSVVAGQNGYAFAWSTISRVPLTEELIKTATVGGGRALGLYDAKEVKSAKGAIGSMLCHLRVVTEFYISPGVTNSLTVSARTLNRAMLDVQRCMSSDPSCDGLALDLLEVANDLDLRQPTSTNVGGLIEWNLEYRHRIDDPSKLMGE